MPKIIRNSDRQRILLLDSGYKLGGGQRILILIARHINKKRFEPIVFCRRGSLLLNILKQEDINTREFYIISKWSCKILNYFLLAINLFFIVPRLIQVVYSEKIKLLHSNRNDMHLPSIIVGKLLGVPVVVHDHLYIKKVRHIIIDFICGLFSNQIISVSKAMKTKLKLAPFSKKKVTVVYNGVSPNYFTDTENQPQSMKKDFGIKENQLMIGTLARISPEKGIEYLIDAFNQIKKQFPNTKLVIVGDAYSSSDKIYKQRILKLIKAYHLQNDVIMPGYRSDVINLIQGVDISVSSSLMESFGLFILESMAMGKAVVATEVGGVPEVVENGRTAILVKPRDSISLAKAISTLIFDEKMRINLGIRGKKRALKYFSIHNTIYQIEDIYDTILKQNEQ